MGVGSFVKVQSTPGGGIRLREQSPRSLGTRNSATSCAEKSAGTWESHLHSSYKRRMQPTIRRRLVATSSPIPYTDDPERNPCVLDDKRGNMNETSVQGVADKVLEDLVAERFKDIEAAVKPEGRSALTAKNIRKVWKRARKAGGDYQGAGEPVIGDVTGGELFDYPLDFDRTKAHPHVVVTSGQVAGMILRPGAPTGEWNK